MKGVAISFDVLFSCVFLLMFLSIYASSFYVPPRFEGEYYHSYKVASDALMILKKTRIYDVQEDPTIQFYMNNGDITPDDMNRTLVDLIGTFWSENRTEDARNVTRSILEQLMPNSISYGVYMGGDVIHERNLSFPSRLAKSSLMVSGYMVGKPTRGFMARAWLQRVRGNETFLLPISPAGSGFGAFYFQGGDFTLEKTFEIPSDAENISSQLDLSVHEERGYIHIYMNDILQASIYSTSTYYGTVNINDVRPGMNVLKIVLERPLFYHSHTHPGMVLKVTYSHEKNLSYAEEREVFERQELPHVIGSPAVWMIYPFDIPKGSQVNSAKLHFEGAGVNRWMEIWVNDHLVYSSSSPPSDPVLNLDIKDYLHLSGNSSTGETNILAIYLDMESTRDRYVTGARGTAEILNSSYVELNYTKPEPVRYYGRITATRLIPFDQLDGQDAALIKKMYFDWTDFPILSSYLHIVQKYSWKVAAAAWHDPEGEPNWNGTDWDKYQIFKSPTGRSVPSSMYIPVERFSTDTRNYVKARDFDGSSSNLILPDSFVSVNFLVPAQVGYGDVFPNQTAAEQDAIQRLNETVRGYVEGGEIETQTTEIVNVPTMWGLTEMEVRVW